ncbi:MAG TPA: hypothetical protein VMI06_00895 [Terriglobia bacterium]|nr:hypothetical protein [Terriglobia bacterium]
MHRYLLGRYNKALRRLGENPPLSLVAQNFIKQLLHNSAKATWHYADLPALPEGVAGPQEDLDIIRLALISRPILVTNDSGLREAVKGHHDLLSLDALDAHEALELARSEHP